MLSMLIQINPFKYGGNYVYQLIQQWKTMNSVYRMLNNDTQNKQSLFL